MLVVVSAPRYEGAVAQPVGFRECASVHVGPQPMATLRAIARVGKTHRLAPRTALMLWAWAQTEDGKSFSK